MKLLLIALVLFLSEATAIAGQSDFIECGCGGGITGGINGIKIYRNGRISEVRKERVVAPVTEVAVASNANIASVVFNLAELNGFLDTSLDKFENITCFVKYHSSNKDHSVYCGASCDNTPRPIFELSQEINKVRDLVKQLQKKRTEPAN